MSNSQRRKSSRDAAAAKAPRVTWSALAPPRPQRPGEIAAILLRSAIPIAGMLWFGWSVVQFLLLTVFNLGLTIGNIGMVGVAVSTLREAAPQSVASGGARIGVGQWITLLVVTAFIALLLTVLGGWPIFVISDNGLGVLGEPALWTSALAMELAVIPAMRADMRCKLQSPLSLAELQARDQPRVGSAFLGVGVSMILSAWAAGRHGFGVVFLVLAFTAFGLLRELRPDLVHEFLRPSNRPPGT